jgi:hypothetical protein
MCFIPEFDSPLPAPWTLTRFGGGQTLSRDGALRLSLPAASGEAYHDAQLSDYSARDGFRWRPPARMSLRAWATGLHVGTAGFGFWNHPFGPGMRGLRLPQAVWFFFSTPPNDMRLALDVPGAGWKAATLDAARWPFLALLPAAPLGMLLMRVPALYRRLWPIGQAAIGVSERLLDAAVLDRPRTYTLDWRVDGIRFAVDGEVVHQAATGPRGPLGFIAWIDNQYAVVTPQGHFGWGVSPVQQAQTLVIEWVRVEGRVRT